MNWGTRLTFDHLGNSGLLVLLSQMVCIIIHVFYGPSRHQLRLLIKNMAAVMLPEPRLISVFYERLCRIESIEICACLHWKHAHYWKFTQSYWKSAYIKILLHIQQCPHTLLCICLKNFSAPEVVKRTFDRNICLQWCLQDVEINIIFEIISTSWIVFIYTYDILFLS